ncbi:MAG: hypothetical protein EA426_20055 [Spirochaetaceae bacterium]|nr:MAG: hypothetical protein EA426_20055 [Spirochaetaceae bacterium]
MSIASFLLNRNSEGRGAGWQTPALWPLDPAEFQRLETMLDDLAKRRFVVFPFAGFFGRTSDFPVARLDQELFIRYVLARLGSYWNLLFNVAGPEPLLRPDDFKSGAKDDRPGQARRSSRAEPPPLQTDVQPGNALVRQQVTSRLLRRRRPEARVGNADVRRRDQLRGQRTSSG